MWKKAFEQLFKNIYIYIRRLYIYIYIRRLYIYIYTLDVYIYIYIYIRRLLVPKISGFGILMVKGSNILFYFITTKSL